MALGKQEKTILADKINALLTSKPEQFDSDDEAEETKAKVVDPCYESHASDDEFRQSKIRKQNIDTLDKVDERYAGKKVSRKEIYSDEDSEDNEESESMENENSEEDTDNEEMDSIGMKQSDDESDKQDFQQTSKDDDNMSDSEEEEKEEKEDNEEEDDDNNIGDLSNLEKYKDSTIRSMSETNVRTEVEKGECVRSQLRLWENLLEMRIKLQKCIVTNNQMPQYDCYKEFRANTEFAKKTDETKSKIALVLNKMLQLKDLLLSQFPETKSLLTDSEKKIADDKGEPMDEEIPSDTEDELEEEKGSSNDENTKLDEEPVPRKRLKFKDYEKILRESHSSYSDYRNTIIKKWNEKTRAATDTLKKSSGQTSTLKQIEFAMGNMSKLRRKTQLKRSEYSVVGKSLPDDNDDSDKFQEYDPEIYDDDDFYHLLLRDLIDYKSSGVTDPMQLSKQWIQLQNLRRKLKRKVDPRASKGRKVRYTVHDKLVNFMAPIMTADAWTDSAKDDLYRSLFGKTN